MLHLSRETYRITVGLGGLGSGPDLCVLSLLFLRSGTLISGDSTGSVQFWDSHHGTLVQALTYHKGDVNALAAVPSQNRVFSAGSDGQVLSSYHYHISGFQLLNILSFQCTLLDSFAVRSTSELLCFNAQDSRKLEASVAVQVSPLSYSFIFLLSFLVIIIMCICFIAQFVMLFFISFTTDMIKYGERGLPKEEMVKWTYVGYIRAHTHDVRALAMTVPINREDTLPDEKVHKVRRQEKPISFSYHRWAHLGVPMLISGGDDAKLFAYSAREFTQFSPHDICPAPQQPLIKLVNNTVVHGASTMLVQSSGALDVLHVKLNGKEVATQLLARVKSKGSRKFVCSAISTSGMLFAYSDQVKPYLFELRKQKVGKSKWSIVKIKLPKRLLHAHTMIFSADSSRLMLAGHDRNIYVVDIKGSELVHTFVPQRKLDNLKFAPSEPPVTKMFTSADGQWLAAINCFGDIYIFNLEIDRQHWFISRLNDASVTAAGFPPKNSNVFVVTTSCNEVFVFDLEAKQLGEWSKHHSHHLPRRFQEFPGEIIGLTFLPFSLSSSVIIYSARAMCFIDFGLPVDQDDESPIHSDLPLEKNDYNKIFGGKRKRKYLEQKSKPFNKKNFDFFAFRDPALFVSHMSDNSLLLIEKQWMEVVRNFDAPIHRHIYGT
ncbi:unnamed protein product [Musa acuminata var. zebrina]